jgi:hypothetical protein
VALCDCSNAAAIDLNKTFANSWQVYACCVNPRPAMVHTQLTLVVYFANIVCFTQQRPPQVTVTSTVENGDTPTSTSTVTVPPVVPSVPTLQLALVGSDSAIEERHLKGRSNTVVVTLSSSGSISSALEMVRTAREHGARIIIEATEVSLASSHLHVLQH